MPKSKSKSSKKKKVGHGFGPKKGKKAQEPVSYSVDGKLKKAEEDKDQGEVMLQDVVGDIDFETMVRQEYMRLHRQYRLMEYTRQGIMARGSLISRQTYLLDLLTNEKEDIETDLKNVDSARNRATDKTSINSILTFLEFYEKAELDCVNTVKSIRDIIMNVDKIMKSLTAQQLKVQSVYGLAMTVPQAERRKRKLEDRLYVATTRNDTLLSKNKDHRDEINMMLKLRGVFYDSLVTIKKQERWVKDEMGKSVYHATLAYDLRDEYMLKVHSLRDKSDKESKQHVLEVKDLQRTLRHDTKLMGFMILKNQIRILGETPFQRQDRINQKKLYEMDTLLAAYARSLRQILRLSNFHNMEALIRNYSIHEQQNFACFKCITDLNCINMYLKDDITTMQTELDGLYLARKRQDRAWAAEIVELKKESAKQELIQSESLTMWESMEEQMAAIIELIDGIFTTCEASNSSVIRLLGNVEGITPTNAPMCMKVIEGRVTELLFTRDELELRKFVELENGPVPKKTSELIQGKPNKDNFGGPYSPQVLLTGHSFEDPEDGDEDKAVSRRPWTYAEIKGRVVEKMSVHGPSLDTASSEAITAYGSASSVASIMIPHALVSKATQVDGPSKTSSKARQPTEVATAVDGESRDRADSEVSADSQPSAP